MPNISVETGSQIRTPSGETITGFKVSFGQITDPASIERSFEDVDKIVKSQPEKFRTSEERENGRFKAYYVATD